MADDEKDRLETVLTTSAMTRQGRTRLQNPDGQLNRF